MVQCVPCALTTPERMAVWSVGWQSTLCNAQGGGREMGPIGLIRLIEIGTWLHGCHVPRNFQSTWHSRKLC